MRKLNTMHQSPLFGLDIEMSLMQNDGHFFISFSPWESVDDAFITIPLRTINELIEESVHKPDAHRLLPGNDLGFLGDDVYIVSVFEENGMDFFVIQENAIPYKEAMLFNMANVRKLLEPVLEGKVI